MKRTLVTVLGSAALLVTVSPVARADAFLSLSSGATTFSCDNSAAFTATNCAAGVFTTVANSNQISFLGGTLGGYSVSRVDLAGAAGPNQAIAADTKTLIQQVGAVASSLTVLFAVNNFATPLGNPLFVSASHSGTFAAGNVGQGENYTGWGNGANTLAVPAGTPVSAPDCLDPTGGVGARSCNASSLPTTFARAGNFALAGREIITLTTGTGVAQFTGITTATATPEPGSLVLLSTGFIGLVGVGGRGMFRRRAA